VSCGYTGVCQPWQTVPIGEGCVDDGACADGGQCNVIPPPIADDYDVPCVPARAEGWQHELLVTLGLANPDAEPAA